MAKKTVHRRKIVRKPHLRSESEETQRETVDSVSSPNESKEVTSVQENQAEPAQSSEANQVSTVSSPPQTMPVTGPAPVVTPSLETQEDEKHEGAVDAEESIKAEGESSELVVAKDESGGGRGILGVILSILKYLLIFALGVSAGGFIVYQNGGSFDFINKAVNKEGSLQKIKVVPTAEPTEKPVDLTKFSITVLNGSEISGEASKLRDSLEKAGFKVSSIGNASESSFLKTVIRAKSDVDKAFLEKLKEELLKTYELDGQEKLEESVDYDVEIIIGAEPQ